MKKIIILIVATFLFCSCKKSDDTLDNRVIENASNQLGYTLNIKKENFKGKVFPRSLDENNRPILVGKKDWTSGFFPGILWLMHDLTHEDTWKEKAIMYTDLLESEKFNASNHDIGFKMMSSYGLAYKFTKKSEYRDVLIQSAKTLATRFNEDVGCIKSWDHHKEKWEFPVIIDNLMNLELLFFAWRETGDSVFYNVADQHAKMTMKNHFRDDYSTFHVVGYDAESGDVISKNTHQGYADDSCWSRGQAWALYGYTMIYRETQNPIYLKQAENAANYILNIANLQKDYVPLWDYSLKDTDKEPRDTSAAAIMASAFIELSGYSELNKTKYLETANLMLESLASNKYSNLAEGNNGFLLKHATGSKPRGSEIDVPLVYGDYYYLEALSRKIKMNN